MNKTIKIKIHSTVDLITNSSTVIFTYSEGAIKEVKEVIDEVLKLQGIDKRADDLFYIDTFLDKTCNYKKQEDFPENGDIDEIINDVLIGKIDRPKWMNDAEEDESWNGYRGDTMLYIKPKESKYEGLAQKLISFLYSTNHEATRDE